jgi:hypothetical protein
VFVVVDAPDALDECQNGEGNRDSFVKELQKLPENVRLLVTSRPIKDIESEFAHSIRKEIQAFEVYISGRLKTDKWLSERVEEDQTLPPIIKKKVIESSRGVYVTYLPDRIYEYG